MAVVDEAFIASGATLGYKLTSGASSFTNVAQLISMEFGGIARDDVESTKLSSTVKTFMGTIADPGDLTLSMYNVPSDASVAAIQLMAFGGGNLPFQIQLPDGTSSTTGTTYSFAGYVNSFAPKGISQADAATVNVSIKISGLITVVAAT